jgi:hypothetical protein
MVVAQGALEMPPIESVLVQEADPLDSDEVRYHQVREL